MIFGLNEINKEEGKDLQREFDQLCEEIQGKKDVTLSIERIGRKEEKVDGRIERVQGRGENIRPVKVKFSSGWEKRLFLSKLVNLRGKERY